MTEVSAWDPVDDNNSAASPAGWPEGMMPSGVNNSARMMMGAVRREHDRIVAQIGSVAGTINSTTINTTTINTTTLSTTGTATIGGTLTVPNIVYSGHAGHTFAFSWDGTATHVYVDGSDVGTIGDITSVGAGNGLTGGGSTGALSLAMSGSYTGSLTVSSTVTAAQLTSNGNINAAADIGARDLYVRNISGGAITGSGTVQGAYVYSTGAMDCAGDKHTPGTAYYGALVLPNQGSVYGRDTGGNPQAMIAMGSNNWIYFGGGGTVTTNAQLAQNNQLYCLPDGGFYCGLQQHAWAGVVSYSYPAPSDRRLKTDIEELPDNCAALVSAIEPKRFRWRERGVLDPTRTHWGFIAQEIGEAFASAGLDFGGHMVGDDDERTETLDTNELVSVLWGALREMMARVEQLEKALVK